MEKKNTTQIINIGDAQRRDGEPSSSEPFRLTENCQSQLYNQMQY